MKNQSKIWYTFLGGHSEDDNIGYYDKHDFEWVKLLEDNYPIIKNEIQNYIEKNEKKIKPYFNKGIATKAKKWRTFSFVTWGWRKNKNLNQCPQTNKIIKQIPHIVSASISILEPGAKIAVHRGDTNATARSHLAIEVPAQLPECGFEINNQKISWKEGQVFIFNDAAQHSAWNNSNKRRYVLLIDVMRSAYVNKKYTVCSMVTTGLIIQTIIHKFPFFPRLPRFIKVIIFLSSAGLINAALRIRNIFNF